MDNITSKQKDSLDSILVKNSIDYFSPNDQERLLQKKLENKLDKRINNMVRAGVGMFAGIGLILGSYIITDDNENPVAGVGSVISFYNGLIFLYDSYSLFRTYTKLKALNSTIDR